MSDLERFTSFLLRHAASYHAPPEAPAEAMWSGIRKALEGDAPEEPRPILLFPEDPGASAAYHEPPEPPREAMWERIEAAWALRRSAPPAARDAGLGELDEIGIDATPSRGERRSIALWISGLAVAASLLIGIALGRGTILFGGAETGIAAGPEGEAPAALTERTAAPAETGMTAPDAGGEAGPDDAEVEPLESSGRLAAGPLADEGARGAGGDEPDPDAGVVTPRADRRDVAARYATAATLGRAETLLTAFRTDASPAGRSELASWARELLGETRLLLDMSVDRTPRERALLQELELVLAQIARLGPEAPDFERDLITEGIERQGTMGRLRNAAATVGT